MNRVLSVAALSEYQRYAWLSEYRRPQGLPVGLPQDGLVDRLCPWLYGVGMDHDAFDLEERAYIEARDKVSDEELIARMNAAPDMGGALLVELSDFVARRADSTAG